MDKATEEKLRKEVINYKLITPAILSERLKIRGSLARGVIQMLHREGRIRSYLLSYQVWRFYEFAGKIRPIIRHNAQIIYTRAGKGPEEPEDEEKDDKKEKGGQDEKPEGGKKGGKKGGKQPKEPKQQEVNEWEISCVLFVYQAVMPNIRIKLPWNNRWSLVARWAHWKFTFP